MHARITNQESEVLRQLSQGSEAAFRTIYDRYWPGIYRTARRYTKSSPLAEDIVQEIFTVLWNKRTTFQEVNHLEYYLFTMTRNLTYKTLRKLAIENAEKEKFLSNGNVKEEPAVDNAMVDMQFEELLESALQRLPSQQKQVFHLAKVEGMSHKDIATQMNISHLTVKAHMAKALSFIRNYLNPHVTQCVLCVILFLQ